MDETIKDKKTLFKERIKTAILKIGNVFKDYPVTLGCIVVIAAIAAVIVDCDFNTDFCEKILLFLGAYSVQALFTEECLSKKLAFRIAGYAAAIPISAFLVYIAWYKEDYLFNVKFDKVEEIVVCVYCSYFVVLGCATLYHMYRRQEETFESYCLKSFFGLLQTTVIYGLFAGGLAIIVLIFDKLIFHTDSFLERLEIFLAGGIYVPALLLVLSGKKSDIGKFSRICVLYVLEPMLILTMAIIYIYIIKIFVSDSIPSNSVFEIITCLFAAGMVIWTLACGIGEDNVFCRIARILPFAFIPCIILQAWSVLIRIADYGYTPQRYVGILLVIFEMIYMVLYTIRFVLKKDSVALILWVAAAMLVIALLFPYFNYASVCIRSQTKRLSGITINEQLKESEQSGTVGSAYRIIKNECGYRGEEAVNKMFTSEEQEILSACYGTSSYSYRNSYYLSDRIEVVSLDISGYRTLTVVSGYEEDPESGTVELKADSENPYKANLSQFFEDIRDYGHRRSLSNKYISFNLEDYAVVKLDEFHDLKVTSFSADYDAEKDELEYISIGGYLLEK
ncbi:MAG: DUF4153 domain-containing protein [Lachnospiraceae bacterium]|nr:DUF4153 domain-containing protein [Lachnospiraceae bacterium]